MIVPVRLLLEELLKSIIFHLICYHYFYKKVLPLLLAINCINEFQDINSIAHRSIL